MVSGVILHSWLTQDKYLFTFGEISFIEKQDIAMTPHNIILLDKNKFMSKYLGNKLWEMILLRKFKKK